MSNKVIVLEEDMTISDLVYLLYRILKDKGAYPNIKISEKSTKIELISDYPPLHGRLNVPLFHKIYLNSIYKEEINQIAQNNKTLSLFYIPKKDNSKFVFDYIIYPIYRKKDSSGFITCCFRFVNNEHSIFKAQFFIRNNDNDQIVGKIELIKDFWQFLQELYIKDPVNFENGLSILTRHYSFTTGHYDLTASTNFYKYVFKQLNEQPKLCQLTIILYDQILTDYQNSSVINIINEPSKRLSIENIANLFYNIVGIEAKEIEQIVNISNVIRYVYILYNLQSIKNNVFIKRTNQPFYYFINCNIDSTNEYRRVEFKFMQFSLKNSTLYQSSIDKPEIILQRYNRYFYKCLLEGLVINLLIQDSEYEAQFKNLLAKIELETF